MRPNALLFLGGLFLLSGCALNRNVSEGTGESISHGNLHGRIQGGQQPVSGAIIQLWAVGTSASGSGATPLIASSAQTTTGVALSDANGNFDITGQYSCPTSNPEVYLTATGGNPGLSGTVNNSAIALMAALGQCQSLTASTFINVNEVTTIASIYELAPFMNSSGQVGSAPADASRLTAGFSTIATLVNTATGSTLGASATVQSTIITLADIIAPCINSSAPNSSPCTGLFALATPPGGTSPATTFAAVLNIALNPTNNVPALFALSTASAPFQPTLASAPSTWSLPISGGSTATLVSLDISPQGLPLYLGTSQQLEVAGVYSDGSVSDLTSQVTWSSANSAVATVTQSGSVVASGAGSASVLGTLGAISGSTSITVNSATSGFTYIDDTADSQLFISYPGGQGTNMTYLGTRGSNGLPDTVTGFRFNKSDGSWVEYGLNSDGSLEQISLSDGSQFGFNYATPAAAALITAVSGDRTTTQSVDLDLTGSGFILTPALRKIRSPVVSKPHNQTAASSTVTVEATSCNGTVPEDGAYITVTPVDAFGGEPIRAFSSGTGTGAYQANLASAESSESTPATIASSISNALEPVCDSLDNSGQDDVAESLAQGCLIFAENPALLAACEALSFGLSVVETDCKVKDTLEAVDSVETFVGDSLNHIDIQVTGTLNGEVLQQTLMNVPKSGPFPQVNLQFSCPKVSKILVDPATDTIPVQSADMLTATPFDSQSHILQSSGFKWKWSSDTPSVATAVTSSYVPVDPVVVSYGLVTGVAPGSATVSATETLTGTSGTSAITVPQPTTVLVSIAPPFITLLTQQTQQFTAVVSNASDASVSWSVDGIAGGNSAVGTVSQSGLYTAPKSVDPTYDLYPFHYIRASSNADPTVSAQATAIVYPASIPVSVNACLSTEASPDGSQSLILTLTNVPGQQTQTSAEGSTGLDWDYVGEFFGSGGIPPIQLTAEEYDGGDPFTQVLVGTSDLSLSSGWCQAISFSVTGNINGGRRRLHRIFAEEWADRSIRTPQSTGQRST